MAPRLQIFQDTPSLNNSAPISLGASVELGKSDHREHISSLLVTLIYELAPHSDFELIGLGNCVGTFGRRPLGKPWVHTLPEYSPN